MRIVDERLGGTFEVCFMMWVYSLMHAVDMCVMTRIVAPMHAMCQHFGVWLYSGIFGKKSRNTRDFMREFLRSCSGYGPGQSVKSRGKSSSLHSKKIFLLGECGFSVSVIISGGLLGHLGPLCLALGANR